MATEELHERVRLLENRIGEARRLGRVLLAVFAGLAFTALALALATFWLPAFKLYAAGAAIAALSLAFAVGRARRMRTRLRIELRAAKKRAGIRGSPRALFARR